jgi:hypothetical protein
MAVCHAQVPKVCKETQRSFVPREERGGGWGGEQSPQEIQMSYKHGMVRRVYPATF